MRSFDKLIHPLFADPEMACQRLDTARRRTGCQDLLRGGYPALYSFCTRAADQPGTCVSGVPP